MLLSIRTIDQRTERLCSLWLLRLSRLICMNYSTAWSELRADLLLIGCSPLKRAAFTPPRDEMGQGAENINSLCSYKSSM